MSLVHWEVPFPAVDRHIDRLTDTQMDIATYKLNWPRGQFSEKTRRAKSPVNMVLGLAVVLC